jgi:hypothetical protein
MPEPSTIRPSSTPLAGERTRERSVTPMDHLMCPTDSTSWSDHDLLAEVEAVERPIAQSIAVNRRVDATGRSKVRIGAALLGLADREHDLSCELRRRRRTGWSSSPREPGSA